MKKFLLIFFLMVVAFSPTVHAIGFFKKDFVHERTPRSKRERAGIFLNNVLQEAKNDVGWSQISSHNKNVLKLALFASIGTGLMARLEGRLAGDSGLGVGAICGLLVLGTGLKHETV